jgi:hypothetical protein
MIRQVGCRFDAEPQRHGELPGKSSPPRRGVAEKTVGNGFGGRLRGATAFRGLRSQRSSSEEELERLLLAKIEELEAKGLR